MLPVLYSSSQPNFEHRVVEVCTCRSRTVMRLFGYLGHLAEARFSF